MLKNSPFQWLFDLVLTLNDGDLVKFENIVNQYKSELDKQPVLSANQATIKQKVILLSIMNLVFNKPSHDRIISFGEIAAHVHVPLEQVEWVLMKALSLKLIKGSINELNQTVDVTWVMPRVLSLDNIRMISEQLGSWSEKVKSTLLTVEDQAAEL